MNWRAASGGRGTCFGCFSSGAFAGIGLDVPPAEAVRVALHALRVRIAGSCFLRQVRVSEPRSFVARQSSSSPGWQARRQVCLRRKLAGAAPFPAFGSAPVPPWSAPWSRPSAEAVAQGSDAGAGETATLGLGLRCGLDAGFVRRRICRRRRRADARAALAVAPGVPAPRMFQVWPQRQVFV